MLKVAGGGGGVSGGVVYEGTWNAATNTPTLTSGIGTKGHYYVVSVSGSTNLDGITDWVAGDWAIFNGTAWEKVDNTESVISVNGQTGVVVLTAANVNAVPDTATITAGTGLTGGGNLAANVTISMSNTAVTIGTYGGGTNAAEITVDQQGRITAAANVTIPQGTLTNVATGTGLTGGPITSNGTISLANTTVTSGTYGGSDAAPQIVIDAQGRITSASNVAIPQGTVTNVATGTGLTGGPITSTGTISLANTAVSAGVYGGTSNSAVITIDAQGRITSASNVAISGGGGSNTIVSSVVTITNGSEVGWSNNTAVVLSWINNSSTVIAWVSNVYQATSNNATILANCAVEPLSIQLPAASGVAGQQFIVKKIDSSANAATITTTSSQKIDNANTYVLSSQYMAAGVQSDGANYWVIAEAS